jgi:hypothetical protein
VAKKLTERIWLRYWHQGPNPIAMQTPPHSARWYALSPTAQRDVIGALATLMRKVLRANDTQHIEETRERQDPKDAPRSSSDRVPETVDVEASPRAS